MDQVHEPDWLTAESPEMSSLLYRALTSDVLAPIFVLNADSQVVYASKTAQAFCTKHELAVPGARYLDLFPARAAAERRRLIDECFRDRRVQTIDGMVKGNLVRHVLRPFTGRHGLLLALVSCSPLREPLSAPTPAIFTQHHDLGPLEALTEREFEVLSLIGRGLSNEELAAELHRSIKTVQGHRLSLGLKLGVSRRIELANIAVQSGLAGMSQDQVAAVWRGARRTRGRRDLTHT